MRRVYKVDLEHQLKSCRKLMHYMYLPLIGLGLAVYLLDGAFPPWEVFLIGTSIFWWMFLMVVPFHIQYLIANWNTKLLVDSGTRTVTIADKSGSSTYPFDDLETERHLPIHHSPGFGKSHRPIPFDYYGYVKIKGNDKKVFYITSLMADPFDFPLIINSTKYRFPFIEGEVAEDQKRKRLEQNRDEKINRFIALFDKLPDEKLINKIKNKERFETEAVEAANSIMDKRKNSRQSISGEHR